MYLQEVPILIHGSTQQWPGQFNIEHFGVVAQHQNLEGSSHLLPFLLL